MEFFLDPRKKLSAIDLVSSTSALPQIIHADATAVAITKDSVDTINAMMDPLESTGYKTHILNDPLNSPDIVIFEK